MPSTRTGCRAFLTCGEIGMPELPAPTGPETTFRYAWSRRDRRHWNYIGGQIDLALSARDEFEQRERRQMLRLVVCARLRSNLEMMLEIIARGPQRSKSHCSLRARVM